MQQHSMKRNALQSAQSRGLGHSATYLVKLLATLIATLHLKPNEAHVLPVKKVGVTSLETTRGGPKRKLCT
jgi:hypothetical protein